MTTKTFALSDIFDKFIQFGAKLMTDCQKYIDVRSLYAAFVETVLACACSCFPPMDAHIMDDDDDDDGDQSEHNKKVKGN